MHEEEVQVAGVVDEESLVAGRHHVAGLLVAAVSDLYSSTPSAILLQCPSKPSHPYLQDFHPTQVHLFPIFSNPTHLWHGGLTAESTAHGIVDTLWLPPAGVDALEAVGLVAVEARSALLHDRDVLLRGGHLKTSISTRAIEFREWEALP